MGDPERLVLPGEPPETDFEDHTLTSNLRAIILAGLCDDVSDKDDDFYEAEDMLGSLLTKAVDTLEGMELATVENDESSAVVSLCSASHVKNMVSWSDVKESTAKDATILSVLELLKVGFPEDIRQVAPDIRQYARYSSQLYELDGVLMLNDRIVIPAAIRKDILKLLHAAHQGVDRMKARASDAMYWPGMVGDITRTRAECTSCHQITKSNPSQPPIPPADPEYPFQQIAADYFHHMGCYYAVIVDRYSHWPSVYRSQGAECGASGLISNLRKYFGRYGVPEEIASDGGPEFTSELTQKFFKDWQIHHRQSSVAFPHSNCRAELAVKTVKRTIIDKCSPSGSLDVDSYLQAMLSYKNTVDPVTGFSPALAVFGRQIRDGIPVLPGKFNPHNTWKEKLEYREKALAQRHNAHHEAWSEHTTKLVPLKNQKGNKPR